MFIKVNKTLKSIVIFFCWQMIVYTQAQDFKKIGLSEKYLLGNYFSNKNNREKFINLLNDLKFKEAAQLAKIGTPPHSIANGLYMCQNIIFPMLEVPQNSDVQNTYLVNRKGLEEILKKILEQIENLKNEVASNSTEIKQIYLKLPKHDQLFSLEDVFNCPFEFEFNFWKEYVF